MGVPPFPFYLVVVVVVVTGRRCEYRGVTWHEVPAGPVKPVPVETGRVWSRVTFWSPDPVPVVTRTREPAGLVTPVPITNGGWCGGQECTISSAELAA